MLELELSVLGVLHLYAKEPRTGLMQNKHARKEDAFAREKGHESSAKERRKGCQISINVEHRLCGKQY